MRVIDWRAKNNVGLRGVVMVANTATRAEIEDAIDLDLRRLLAIEWHEASRTADPPLSPVIKPKR
jgi:hypothetical protein